MSPIIYKKDRVFRFIKNVAELADQKFKEKLPQKEYSDFKFKNNFFLATEWMKTEFPLYQQSPQCPDCLLDYDDWKIKHSNSKFYELYSFCATLRTELLPYIFNYENLIR